MAGITAPLGIAGNARRKEILKILEASRRGHLGSAFSVVEILHVLYGAVLKVDPVKPLWKERDRFILSKGHACLALYVELAERGFFQKRELERFCAFDGILGGHPEHGLVPGVEASTGSLGHGLSIGTGMALAAKTDRKGYRVFVLMSDAECDEGTTWEAALSAAKHGLDNLTVILDYNKMQCYAPTRDVLDLEPLARKWESFNFEVREADGHDTEDLKKKLSKLPYKKGKPSLLLAHTVKGKGIPQIENDPLWHHKARLTDDEMQWLWKAFEKASKRKA